MKVVIEISSLNKLMKFLMGLNDTCDGVRNQILVTDPQPQVNKANLLIFTVEKQRRVNIKYTKMVGNSAMLGKG